MKFNRIVRGMIVGMAFAASLVLVGCAVEAGNADALEGDVGETAEAIGAECERASPTARFVGGFDYTSPQTYSTTSCYKAVVVDVYSYNPTPPNDGFVYNFLGTVVGWADVPPSTQAACEQAWVRADLFEVVGAVRTRISTQERFGSWVSNAFGFQCDLRLNLASQMQDNHHYRIAATARTDNTSGAPTRKVFVESLWSIVPS